jgi:hypothetical protein
MLVSFRSHHFLTDSIPATALCLVVGTSAAWAQSGPQAFTAEPFSPEFVIVGTQDGVGAQYVPANGDGTFGAPTDVPGLSWVLGVDVADIDGDDDLDFLAADGLSGTVYRYQNDGNGTFTPERVASVKVSVQGTTSLRIADFNQDERPDFIVGDAFVTGGVQVFLQNPAGRFRRGDRLDLSWHDGPSTTSSDDSPILAGVAVGDIDGDDDADIVLLGQEGEGGGEVRLYRNNGKGRFGDAELLFDIEDAFGVNLHATGLAAFDLEGDDDLDLAVGDATGAILLYTNTGIGGFTAPAAPAVFVQGQSGIDAYDADGDGDHDLMIHSIATQTLSFVENQDGTLAEPAVASTVGGSGVAVGAPPLPAPPQVAPGGVNSGR